MNKGKISPQARRQISQLSDEVIEDKREIPSSEMPIIEKGVDEEKATEPQVEKADVVKEAEKVVRASKQKTKKPIQKKEKVAVA